MSVGSYRKPAGNPEYSAILSNRREELRGALGGFLVPGKPFVWELGSGHGHFLTAYAEAHPNYLCLGIDLASERVARATRKQQRAELANLYFIRAEARLFVETLPESSSFAAVFVLFPDPWPKLRHHKHRIMQSDFLKAVAGRAAPDCRLYFRTDFEPYFDDTRAIFADHPSWEVVAEPWPFEHETVFQQRAGNYFSLVARLRPSQP